MKLEHPESFRFVTWVALSCYLCLILGVIWSSDRALEITDEAYYLLSAIHPEEILLYISAQHWILGPLWKLTESLQGFRLTGAMILIGTSGILGLGAVRMLGQLTDFKLSALETLSVVAASGVGALLYVATIAPSPSYNLLASSGAYAAAGLAFLAIRRRGLLSSIGFSFGAGLFLAICFVNKPSAGICSALVVCVLILGLERSPRNWILALIWPAGTFVALLALVQTQPSELAVADSFSRGLELFQMVQTEPVGARLIRYAVTLLTSFGATLMAFWPAMLMTAVLLLYPRRGVSILTLSVFILNIIYQKSYLGGSFSYTSILEGIYALTFIVLVSGFRAWSINFRTALFFSGLIVLPFSVAIGTGNSLFTQIFITLAPWTIAAALLAYMVAENDARRIMQQGSACLLLLLMTSQILTSYTREPYHLSAPLTQHTQTASVGVLGELKVDTTTIRFLTEVQDAIETCSIEPGARFMGFFHVPGLALVFQAIPPVIPWLNNPDQTEVILEYWAPETANRIVTVLTSEIQSSLDVLPERLNPLKSGYTRCGEAITPYGQGIEVWASSKRSSN
jgi:hypothetical protein